MKIDQSLQVPLTDMIRVSVYAPLPALSLIFPNPFPISPFEESGGGNPACVEVARQISACLFTPAPASHVMPDPIRCLGYTSRDKYTPEEAQLMDAELMDMPIDGIHIIFDHQVSSDDEDPDVVHLWIDEELKVTGRKYHKTDQRRANDIVKMHKSTKEFKGGL